MTTGVKQQQSKRVVTKARDQTTGQTSEAAETATGHCDGVETGVRPAYRTYLEAQKGLAKAFRGRERQDQEAYKDAERRYQIYEEAMERAMKVREKAERDALDAYRETVNKASGAYRERMKQALIECKQRIEDAWRASRETSAEMTVVFDGDDRNIRKEEQSQEESLGQEPEGVRFRERILHWKSRCVSILRQAVKARGQSAG